MSPSPTGRVRAPASLVAAASLALALPLPPRAARAQSASEIGAQAARPPALPPAETTLRLASPDGRSVVTVELRDGVLHYHVARGATQVLLPSRLGFAFRGAEPLQRGLRLVDSARAERDTTFALPWGEVARVRDHHRELRVRVAEAAAPGRTFAVVFRAFDDGVAFRYELPAQPALGDFAMTDELTEFALAEDPKAWWITATRSMPDRQEQLYTSSPASMADTVHTPLTLQLQSGVQAVIHEADLVDYAGMYLGLVPGGGRTFRTSLARWKDGTAVQGRTPFVTPWRTIQLADRVEELAPSTLTLRLNPPSRVADASVYRPMKYNGVWWGMHINTETWESGPKHGATTANVKRYLDFAAAHGLGGTLVEGWNRGWEDSWVEKGAFSFTEPYPDFDLAGLARYARSKGLTLIGHHETATNVTNYERQLDSAMALYARVGVRAVKTGYVGDTTDQGHAHQSQYMVRHHRRVIETAARHGIGVDMHEPIKDTGERRTWPNMMSREGSRGMEFNAWGGEGGNPPEHETILFFTRLLAGPMDFTPGIFDLTLSRSASGARKPWEPRPRTTLAKQLALYVVIYSPLQMVADVPESYLGPDGRPHPALKFIRDVAVDWDTTRVLSGRIGDHVVVARKAKGRDEWFVGAITDEEARTVEVPTDFLPRGRRYVAEFYADGPGAHWRDAPTSWAGSSRQVDATTRLRIAMAPGGGQAIRIRPAR